MIMFQRTLVILIGGILLVVAGWCGLQVYQLSNTRAAIKKDYSVLNNITYGLLSVNAWRDHMVRVVTHRIDDFEFTPEQEAALKHEVSQVLHAVINKADSMIDRKQRTVGGKIKKFAVRALVNENKLHDRVPEFAQTIVNEVKKPKNREKLKYLAQSKLEEFGTITYDSMNDIHRVEVILQKYGAVDVVSFNKTAETRLAGLQDRAYFFTYAIVGILVLFLVVWLILRNRQPVHTPFFIVSVSMALLVLCVGLTTPMIEIDARIKEMSFQLIGEPISFHDQVIFFQSKSIVDVVRILLETGKFDSAFVGILILIFSIVFPIGKLLATKVYLLGNQRWRDNRFIQFFAFKAGKWSMADVNVVAIFMAYIGFKGILDSQLAHLNMKTDSLASISTNETSLQPGFILFVSFVLFGLILSVILHRITLPEVERAALAKQRSERSSWRRLVSPASRYFHS
ncbi:paraquat-inducible protein A [Fulvivirgaceae bacterium PWU5]|uniref:Paraquat-inducible protein A n=1 Tax=Dawidia cretensis TaxID=2782350 RepID=A0AAP2DXK4_9BACT|nr:paraquat-inducible protein A [Dawidia cretensis]MBT1709191.1 paraquat-inducible protein A [Dawidia cretensis]